MEAFEEELDPAQSLQVITAVIAKTKENIKEHSFLFLLWGWLIAISSFSFFMIHAYTSFKLFFLPFPVLSFTGIIISVLYYTGRSPKPETYINYYLKKLWLGLCLNFF